MQQFKGHSYFVATCKSLLDKDVLTQDALLQATDFQISRLTSIMAMRFRCWRPKDPAVQRRVIWEYLTEGHVYPMGTVASRIHRTEPIKNPPWIGPHPSGERPVPSVDSVDIQPRPVIFTGSAYEKAMSPWWETVCVVACIEVASRDRDRIALPFQRHIRTVALLDIFRTDGRPIYGVNVYFGEFPGASRIAMQTVLRRICRDSLPYSIPKDISNIMDVIPSAPELVRVNAECSASRVVLVVREARMRTLEELVDSVKIRTVFEARYVPDAADVACTTYKIPTVCQLGFSRIRYPVRGSACRHDSFSDLETFLEFQKQAGLFMCPICDGPLPMEQIEMCDPFYRALIAYPDAAFLAWDGTSFRPALADTSRKHSDRPAAPAAAMVIEID